MNKSELTPLWKAANNSLSSISSTVRASLLKRVMKDCKLSFSPCSMVNRLEKKCLCLYPPMKLLTNNLLNSSKELTVLGGILLNHTRAGPLRVIRKTLHIILFGTPWRCIVVLKLAIWSKGSRIPSYESKKGILNFRGKGWPLMEAVKGESIQWTKSSTGFALLMFSLISSMTFLIWSISFSKCGTLCEVVHFDWLSGSTFPSLSSWLWVCPTYLSCHCLLRLISLANSCSGELTPPWWLPWIVCVGWKMVAWQALTGDLGGDC